MRATIFNRRPRISGAKSENANSLCFDWLTKATLLLIGLKRLSLRERSVIGHLNIRARFDWSRADLEKPVESRAACLFESFVRGFFFFEKLLGVFFYLE